VASSKEKEQTKSADTSTDLEQEVSELIKILQGDLSSIDPQAGLESIDRWQEMLSKSKESGAKELATALKDLHKLLKGGKATGIEISESLIHIGEQTTELAADATAAKQSLQKLGKQLRTAGTSIAKAEEKEYHTQLDSLLDQVEEDELTAIDPTAATVAIDFWYNILHHAEGEQFKSLAKSLDSLKKAIAKDNSKPETIAKALAHMGEQTTELASSASRGFKGAIQKLGKGLTAASEAIADRD
jgi:recombinational DNA repair protein RecR